MLKRFFKSLHETKYLRNETNISIYIKSMTLTSWIQTGSHTKSSVPTNNPFWM